jgi:LuxR family maltose regulon positive regulatory protein
MRKLLHAAAERPAQPDDQRAGDDEEADEQVQREHHQEMLRAWARQLLEPAPSPVDEPGTAGQSLADPLSQREVEVLRLLDSELTGPQIAKALYVSLNTMRTHTKRIFTKLDVKTRAAAVRRAHEQGLL